MPYRCYFNQPWIYSHTKPQRHKGLKEPLINSEVPKTALFFVPLWLCAVFIGCAKYRRKYRDRMAVRPLAGSYGGMRPLRMGFGNRTSGHLGDADFGLGMMLYDQLLNLRHVAARYVDHQQQLALFDAALEGIELVIVLVAGKQG